MINSVTLIGRNTKPIEVRKTAGGTSVASFSLAVDRKPVNGKKEADFISCVAFGKTAEYLEMYSDKGSVIAVSGKIQTGKYQNRTGATVYTTNVIVNEASILVSTKNKQQEPKQQETAPENYDYQADPEDLPW